MDSDLRRLVLMACLALWALMWGGSFAAFVGTEPGAEVSAPGSDRMATFLGWQMAAALPAFTSWVLGRDWPVDSGVRRLSRVPLQLAVGLAAVFGGLVLWTRLAG